MKKSLLVILILVMAIALLPASALADGVVDVADAAALQTALTNGESVRLTADIDVGDFTGTYFAVPLDFAGVLDLNGFTIEGRRLGVANTQLFRNLGVLTIEDTSAEQDGKLVISSAQDSSWSSYAAVVSNEGTLTIASGTLQNLGGTSMAYVVDNNSTSYNVTLTVAGGALSSENYIAIRQFANSTSHLNTVTITGGTVYGYKRGVWIQQPNANHDLASLAIEGGTVQATTQSAVMADMLSTEGGVSISVSGGTLLNDANDYPTLLISQEATNAGGAMVAITGGQLTNAGSGGNLAVEATDTTTTIVVSAGAFSSPVPEEYIAEDAEDGAIIIGGSTVVDASVEPTYTIIIPSAVSFGTLQKTDALKEVEFSVIAQSMLLEQGASIKVSVASDFLLNDGHDNELAYSLYNQNGTVALSSGEIYASFNSSGPNTGKVTVNPSGLLVAGEYAGTMTFTVSYAEPTP